MNIIHEFQNIKLNILNHYYLIHIKLKFNYRDE
jgi:hypothetical protein